LIVKTLKGSFYEPRQSFVIESDNYMREEGMISDKQKNTLASLIYSRIPDADECERRISQIEDMTYAEAEEEIFSFLSSQWR
jgi:hypothetical protein